MNLLPAWRWTGDITVTSGRGYKPLPRKVVGEVLRIVGNGGGSAERAVGQFVGRVPLRGMSSIFFDGLLTEDGLVFDLRLLLVRASLSTELFAYSLVRGVYVTEEKKAPKEVEVLISNTVYPEADSVFTAHPRTLQEVRDDSVIVLDTNSLLVPYSIGKKSLAQIKKTYQALASHKRLVIPGQVAREFAKNRATKLGELFQQLNRKRAIGPFAKGKYPLLESLSEYKESVRLEEKLDTLLEDYKKAVAKTIEHVQSWTWNDPVSLLYRELFGRDTVFDPIFDEAQLKEELAIRYSHQIPPGYKDGGKDDAGIGDLLIWKAILELGKKRKKDVVFVSGEEKPDWWHKSEGQPLYPRFELFDEYRRASGGRSFHIVPFSKFLDLYGASEEVVAEVRKTEMEESAAQAATLAEPLGSIRFPFTINNSFLRSPSHPITIPRAYHDHLALLLLPDEDVSITSPYGSVNGHIYCGRSGWGEYYQIHVRGGTSPVDPMRNFLFGQTVLVQIEWVNNAVQVMLSPTGIGPITTIPTPAES